MCEYRFGPIIFASFRRFRAPLGALGNGNWRAERATLRPDWRPRETHAPVAANWCLSLGGRVSVRAHDRRRWIDIGAPKLELAAGAKLRPSCNANGPPIGPGARWPIRRADRPVWLWRSLPVGRRRTHFALALGGNWSAVCRRVGRILQNTSTLGRPLGCVGLATGPEWRPLGKPHFCGALSAQEQGQSAEEGRSLRVAGGPHARTGEMGAKLCFVLSIRAPKGSAQLAPLGGQQIQTRLCVPVRWASERGKLADERACQPARQPASERACQRASGDNAREFNERR